MRAYYTCVPLYVPHRTEKGFDNYPPLTVLPFLFKHILNKYFTTLHFTAFKLSFYNSLLPCYQSSIHFILKINNTNLSLCYEYFVLPTTIFMMKWICPYSIFIIQHLKRINNFIEKHSVWYEKQIMFRNLYFSEKQTETDYVKRLKPWST